MSTNKLKLAEYFEFVRWYATPRPYRQPKTQGEFANLHGIGVSTITVWKSDPDFNEDVRRVFMDWTYELVPEMIGAIFNSAKKGDVRAQELFMKYFSKLPNPNNSVVEDHKEIGPNLAAVLLERAKARENKISNVPSPDQHSDGGLRARE